MQKVCIISIPRTGTNYCSGCTFQDNASGAIIDLTTPITPEVKVVEETKTTTPTITKIPETPVEDAQTIKSNELAGNFKSLKLPKHNTTTSFGTL